MITVIFCSIEWKPVHFITNQWCNILDRSLFSSSIHDNVIESGYYPPESDQIFCLIIFFFHSWSSGGTLDAPGIRDRHRTLSLTLPPLAAHSPTRHHGASLDTPQDLSLPQCSLLHCRYLPLPLSSRWSRRCSRSLTLTFAASVLLPRSSVAAPPIRPSVQPSADRQRQSVRP